MFISRALTPCGMQICANREGGLSPSLGPGAWACERFSDYIVGKSIVTETDQKPLVPLLTSRTLDEVPPRVQRLRIMRLMCIYFKEVNHVPGKEMFIADALSRVQSENTNRMATVPEEEMKIYVDSVLDSLPGSDVKLMEIKEAQDEDLVCRQIKNNLSGQPSR